MKLLPRLAARMKDYASYHRSHSNRVTHWVGIPLIMWAVLGLLGRWVWGPYINGGQVLIGLTIAWLLIQDWRVAIPFTLFTYGLYLVGLSTPERWLWIWLMVGWAIQLFGHAAFEKKSPAFVRNLEHLLVGPVWFFLEICALTGLGADIKTQT